jgi:hypothetical protein
MATGQGTPVVPINFGPGLSMYNLMEPAAILGPDGTVQMQVLGVTQDIAAAFAWMMQKTGRSVALNFVLAVNTGALQTPPKQG